jgi:hypothetical protein
MAHNSDNRRRAFADVVTVDAWHKSFDGKRSKADLHADVVFGTARLGGEQESPIRFRLSVKKAEIVVVIPDSEPLSVDKASVARESPETHGHITEVVEQSTKLHAKGSFSSSLSPSAASAGASAEAGAQRSRSAHRKSEISRKVDLMIVTSSKTPEGHYRWLIKPSATSFLEGRPWNAAENPRLKLIDERKARSKSVPPTVRVEVHCRREDLIIEDLEIKDENIWEAVKARVGFKNRRAAAVSYIRDRLTEEGLEVKNIDDIFGEVTLASVTADSV